MTGSHLPALDAIRGLAILLVTLYRFRLGPDDGMWFEHVYTHVLSLGERGVDLFFVLSGFLITGILFDSKSDRHYFRNFYMRRSLRIFPLYYGVLLGCFVILPIVWPANIQYPFADARELQNWLWLYGVNMRVGWHNDWCFGSFNHFWSLAVEEHFYLIWPLAIFVLSRRSAMNVCVVFGIFALVARIAWLVLGGNGLAPEVFTPFQFDALLIGAWLALAARGPGGLAALVPACRLAFPLCLGLLLPEMV
ncbi:MAG: acyltransferase, partial [Planctomycetales bacterium]|nr:acyltransferase [Planctomycetales bacterium]